MLIACIAATRPHVLPVALASVADCDRVVVECDDLRTGIGATRNRLVERVLERAFDDDTVRFVDDDDIAVNSRQLLNRIPSDSDVLAFSYLAGGALETVPSDPLAATIDSVIGGNWMIRVGALRRLASIHGTPFDPRRAANTAAWFWTRLLDADLRIAFAPELVGYLWRQGLCSDSVSMRAGPDHALFAELRRRISASGRWDLLLPLMARMDRKGIAVDRRTLEIGRRFKATFGRYPNLRSPRSFNEKIAWRKVYDRNILFDVWADKLAARAWAAERLGEDIAPRLLAVVEDGGTVPPIDVPHVMKANHGSGMAALCAAADWGTEPWIARARTWLSRTYGLDRGEEAYLRARRAVLFEEVVPHARDVKLYCFDGRVVCLHVDHDLLGDRVQDFYDPRGRDLGVRHRARNCPARTSLEYFRQAIAIAERLSRGIDFVRVDLLESHGRLWFGEMTAFPNSGNVPFDPPRFDDELGAHWDLTGCLATGQLPEPTADAA